MTSTSMPGPHFGPSRATTSNPLAPGVRCCSSRGTEVQTLSPLTTQRPTTRVLDGTLAPSTERMRTIPTSGLPLGAEID